MGKSTSVSNSDRAKIIKHKQNGEKSVDIARWFFLSEAEISVIWNNFKQTGEYLLKYSNCGRKTVISPTQECKIIAKIKKNPDTTLLELIEKFELPITESGLSKWLTKRGYSFKKRLLIRQSKTALMSKKSV